MGKLLPHQPVRIVLVSLALVGFLSFLYLFDPVQYSFYPSCIFHKMTGYDCPGCGTGRALHALAHGDIKAAADYNILLLFFLPVIGAGLLSRFSSMGRRTWNYLDHPRIFGVIICVFWLLRNTGIHPFLYLNSSL